MIGSALAVITEALSTIGIDLSTQSTNENMRSRQEQLQDEPVIHGDFLPHAAASVPMEQSQFDGDEIFHVPPLYEFNPEGFEISSEMLEAFSFLKPIDASIGARQEWDD